MPYRLGSLFCQDFYITLDLTTHVPVHLTHDKKAKGLKTGRGSNKSLANAPGTSQTTTPQDSAAAREDGASPAPQSQPLERMQIVDLHSRNPLVSFNNNLYSCHWATDVGTSLYFTSPRPAIDPHHPPIRSTPTFDLLGASCARLIAVPATMKPRTVPVPAVETPQEFVEGTYHATKEGDIVRQVDSQGFHIELPSTASASKVRQARFLERLSAIKAQRGDSDAVPINNVKMHKPPEGWEAERDEWIAKETSRSEKNRLEAEIRIAKHQGRSSTNAALASYDRNSVDSEEVADLDEFLGPGVASASDEELDTPDPEGVLLPSQYSRKRKTRGGPRGGAPSGKKLRQSLGLPEARRDKRAPGRPRQIRLDSEFRDGEDAASVEAALSPQASAEPSAEPFAELSAESSAVITRRDDIGGAADEG